MWMGLIDLLLVQARRQRLRELVRLLLVSDAQGVKVLQTATRTTKTIGGGDGEGAIKGIRYNKLNFSFY